ncbi:CYTH domain-containing protein [Falsiroseomonas sp.]|uniref:CYTH domain-containing protein n=1 Tax=Falsiroseomonas sp. TaxID=2870721 RepID=UPI003F703A1B
MGIEIERKFLVAGEAWRQAAQGPGLPIRQGYLSTGPGPAVVRVRIAGPDGYLTIKGPGRLVRAEFEYPIPLADAQALLGLCATPPLAKTRHAVPHEGHIWTVDVFEAPERLAGLVLAEVELPDAGATPPLPAWLGAEVTQDPRYANAALALTGPPRGDQAG